MSSRSLTTSLRVSIIPLVCANIAWGIAIETVPVGNRGNTGELSGEGAGGYGPDRICGAVDYIYRIGTYEVTTRQYTAFLNAVADEGDGHGLYNPNMAEDDQGCGIQRTGQGTAGDPYIYSVAEDRSRRSVNFVNWYDSARFCNWMTSGGTETGSYDLTGGDIMDVTRSEGAVYAMPSEDEWYKAAFYCSPALFDPPVADRIGATGHG